MKYIIYLFVIVLFQSCTTEMNEKSEIVLSESSNIHYVEFKKHRYIHYRNGTASVLVHDPDCPYCEFKKK